MRVFEDKQQSTTCLHDLLSGMWMSSERRVLSDKKIKKSKKINLSLNTSKIHQQQPQQKQFEYTSTKNNNNLRNIDLSQRTTRPMKAKSRQKLMISSFCHKTPATTHLNQASNNNYKDTDCLHKNISYQTKHYEQSGQNTDTTTSHKFYLHKKNEVGFQETSHKNLSTLRAIVSDNRLKTNLSRKISFNNDSQLIDHENNTKDYLNTTRRKINQKLTNSKPPFFNIYEQGQKNKVRPYLYLDRDFETNRSYQTDRVSHTLNSQHLGRLENENKLSKFIESNYLTKNGSLSHRNQRIKAQIYNPSQFVQGTQPKSIKQSATKTIKYSDDSICSIQSKIAAQPILEQLRKSLQKNHMNRILESHKQDAQDIPSNVAMHVQYDSHSDIALSFNDSHEYNDSLKNKQSPNSHIRQMHNIDEKVEQQSYNSSRNQYDMTAYMKQRNGSQNYNQDQRRDIIYSVTNYNPAENSDNRGSYKQIYHSTKKQPLKRLNDGAPTIVSKFDQNSAQKSDSIAFSHCIFRMNGDMKRQNSIQKNQESYMDNQPETSEKFKHRLAYSYKSNNSPQFIKNSSYRMSYNNTQINKYNYTINQLEENINEVRDHVIIQNIYSNPEKMQNRKDQQQSPKAEEMSKSNTFIDSLHSYNAEDIEPSQDDDAKWRKRIQQIYIVNKLNHDNTGLEAQQDLWQEYPMHESFVVDNLKVSEFDHLDHINGKQLAKNDQTCYSRQLTANRQQKSMINNCWKFHERFKKISYLGVGRFSSVYMYCDVQTACVFALKEILKFVIISNNYEKRMLKEIQIHSQLNHPHIVDFYHSFEDHKKYYIAVEYAGQSLFKYVERSGGRLPQQQCLSYIYDIAKGLLYLHQQMKIVHRDIKPENIMKIENVCKIGDFGCADRADRQVFMETIGTPCYISPQVDQLKPYTFKTDCWSLGVLALQIRIGRLDEPILNLPSQFINGDTSQEYQEMVSMLLGYEQSQRISIKQLLALPIFMNIQE